MIPRVPIRKVMSEKLITVDQAESALRAAQVMTELGIGAVLVTCNREVIGIVSESDLVRKVLGRGLDPKQVKLESIMSYPAMTIDEAEPLEEAYRIMGQNQIRHLVVTRKEAPCGMVSSRSFMESIYP